MTGSTQRASARLRADARAVADSPWLLLAGLFLLTASAAAYQIVPASINPVVMDRLEVGPVAASWLVSVMFLLPVFASVPSGVLLDRVDLNRAISAATLLLIAVCAWGWAAADAGSYRWLIVSRGVGALAFVTVWNAANSVVNGAFDARNRATAVGLYTASGAVGFALAQFTGPLLVESLSLGAAMGGYAVLAVAGLAVFAAAGGAPAPPDGSAAAAVPSGAELRAVLTDRRVWHISALGFCAYALYLFINSWLPTYMNEVAGLSLAQSGLFVAFFPAMGALSRMSSGLISDRLFGARRRPVAVLSFAVTAPTFVGFALVSNVAVLFVLLAISGYFVQLGLGLFFSYVREVVDPGVAATAISLLTAVGGVGAFVAPIGAGWLIESTGGYAVAFGVAAALTVVALGGAWVAPRTAGG